MTTQIEDAIEYVKDVQKNAGEGTWGQHYSEIILDALRFKQQAEQAKCSPTLTECPLCKNDIRKCPMALPQPVAPDRAELIAENFDLKLQLQNAKQAISALSSPPDRVSVPREPFKMLPPDDMSNDPPPLC